MVAIVTSYLHNVLNVNLLRLHVRRAALRLKPHLGKFDSIAFCGVSGALFGPMLAARLRKHMIVVRKPQSAENTHSIHNVEGYLRSKAYIIVDDLVCTGKTLKYIVETIDKAQGAEKAKAVGLVCYQQGQNLYEYQKQPVYKSLSENAFYVSTMEE